MIYTTFKELCNTINNELNVNEVHQISHANGNHIGIVLKNKHFPISINEAEYNFMHKFIIDNNLKTGFELSTGTGISTIGIGTAMAITNGHLITMDSYYEDITGISQNIPVCKYNEENINNIKENSECYKFISKIIKKMNLENIVQIEIGWSPLDSVIKIKERNQPLDFIFLDCPKNSTEFIRDFIPLTHFLNDKYVIFVHDTHTFDSTAYNVVLDTLGIPLKLINEYFINSSYHQTRYYPLGIITNII